MGWLKERRFCEQCGEALPDNTPGNVKYCSKHAGVTESNKRYEQREQEKDPERRAKYQKEWRDRHKNEEEFIQRNRDNTQASKERHPENVKEKGKRNSADQYERSKNDAPDLAKYSRYIRAKNKGQIPFDMTYEEYDASY